MGEQNPPPEENNNPRISVLIPVYNGAETIGRCIFSILKQTYSDFKIIVLDDCSTDNTVKIVKDMMTGDKRIELLLNSKNTKRGACRNFLMQNCKTEFGVWCDADDYMHPEKLQTQIAYMEENPDCNFVMTNMYNTGNANAVDMALAQKINVLDSAKLMEYNPVLSPTIMFRSEIGKRISYNEDVKFDGLEDWGYVKLLYASGGRVDFIDKPLYYYSGKPIDKKNIGDKMIFRFDDISINSDLQKANDIAFYIKENFPKAEIWYAISPLVFSIEDENKEERERPFPRKFTPMSDVRNYFLTDKCGVPDLDCFPPFITRASHSLFHADLRLLTPEQQEMSIISSACLTRSSILVPPFNKWNQHTERICNHAKIKLVKFEHGWRGMEHESWDDRYLMWYLHDRKWDVEKLKKYFRHE